MSPTSDRRPQKVKKKGQTRPTPHLKTHNSGRAWHHNSHPLLFTINKQTLITTISSQQLIGNKMPQLTETFLTSSS
jgi:hypothetical protein